VKKNESKNQYSFEFDEQGATVVSEQIMNAYNSGFIDQEELQEDRDELGRSETTI
jgi:hypothetical protein